MLLFTHDLSTRMLCGADEGDDYSWRTKKKMERNFRGLFKVLNMIFKLLSGRAVSALKLQTYRSDREHTDIRPTIKNSTEIFTHATPAIM
jgi:hypothetical protein